MISFRPFQNRNEVMIEISGRSLQPKNLIDVDVGETLSVERINGKGNSLLSGIEHSYGEVRGRP